MNRAALLAACAVAVALAPLSARAEAWAIEHVTLIDGTGHAPQPDMTVTVDGERIISVAASAVTPAPKGRRIDGRGKYLMPGLMDVHIHLHGGAGPQPDLASTKAAATQALASYLYSGVTTVYDAGNQADVILPLRADERAGKILSPRIFATGNLITYPGSHGTNMAVNVQDFEKDKDKLDKHIAEQQPDVVKLTLEEEGWGARPMITLMPEQLLRDVIRYYNLHGIRTTIHVSSELRAEEAIFAGTDSLAHPVIQGPVSDSFVKLMGAKKIPFASTLTIGENYSRLAEHPEFLDQPLYAATFSPADRQTLKTKVRAQYQARMWTAWMKLMTPVAEENVRKVHDAGGVVAMGTDQSSGPASQRELEL
ncbi:MAG TPA: amidohydrolase family protein, partial [Phenylobacterium sp.]|nr:amidohydrolase family protein [Phenylobacterium sp.]